MGLTATRVRRLVPLAAALVAFIAAPALAEARLPHGLGLIARPAATAAHGPRAFRAQSERLTSLPVSVDLTRWAVPPGDQGPVGSCTTWAVAYTAMGYWETRQGISTPGDGEPMYAYSQIAQGVDQGSSYEDVFNIAETQGIDNQADYWQGNFDFTTQPTPAERSNATHWVLSGHFGLPLDRYDIENALANGYPVAIAIPVTMSFEYNDSGDYPDDNGQDDTSSLGNHAITALGYDATGLKIENSWGTNWGNGGFVRISWDWLATHIEDAYGVKALKQAPINNGAPIVSGATTKGHTLTATPGNWNFGYDDGATYSYQWQRCDAGTCTNFGGAGLSAYRLTSADVGHALRVVVTATSAGGTATAVSAQTAIITGPPPPAAPHITRHPSASTRQRSATFTVTDSTRNATFQCKLDKGPWRACRSALVYRKLGFGTHTWSVRAVLAGDLSRSASWRWRVHR